MREEGWDKIFNLKTNRMLGKFHYFREGVSLCGKYMLSPPSSANLEPERGLIRFRCVICLKDLKGGNRMKFEKYVPSTKVHINNPNPYIHFSKGHAWINEAGILKYFSSYTYAEFSFCREKEVIRIAPVQTKTGASLKLSGSSNGKGRFISMQGFYHKFPIRKIVEKLKKNDFLIVEAEDHQSLLVYLG